MMKRMPIFLQSLCVTHRWGHILLFLVAVNGLIVHNSINLALSANSPSPRMQVEATSTTASLEIQDVPLVEVLRTIGAQVGFEVEAEDPGPRRSLSLNQVPLGDALEQLLLGTNFVIQYAPTNNAGSSSSRTIATIYLLPGVSAEKAEDERAARAQEATVPQYSSEDSDLLEPEAFDETLPTEPESNDSSSQATTRALDRLMNTPPGLTPSSPEDQEDFSASNQDGPFQVPQETLDRVRSLAEQLKRAQQQLEISP